MSSASSPLYAQIGQRIGQLIDGQVFRVGQRLPSVRDVAAQNGVSVSTAVQAFHWLEERHLVVAKPKAGHFVAPPSRRPALPAISQPPRHSLVVQRKSRTETIAVFQPEGQEATFGAAYPVVSFGGACPKEPSFFDDDRVRVALARATRIHRQSLIEYSDLPGTPRPARGGRAARAASGLSAAGR